MNKLYLNQEIIALCENNEFVELGRIYSIKGLRFCPCGCKCIQIDVNSFNELTYKKCNQSGEFYFDNSGKEWIDETDCASYEEICTQWVYNILDGEAYSI